jgi:hypothetical protein
MKWFLIVWTVGGLVAMNLAFPNYFRDSTAWALGNALCVPFFAITGLIAGQFLSGVLQKFRKVQS